MIAGSVAVHADDLLTGVVIGTRDAVDYSTNARTTTVNTRVNAFDGNMDTFSLPTIGAIHGLDSTWANLMSSLG